jgi:hypothetical protein
VAAWVTSGVTSGAASDTPGAGVAVITIAATVLSALILVLGVTFGSLVVSLAGVVLLAAVAAALHRRTGGRAALVAGIVPWGMLPSVSIPAYWVATTPVNTHEPRESTGLILFAFLFLVLGAVGTLITSLAAAAAWRRPGLALRIAGPIAVAFALLDVGLAGAGGARLARRPDAKGYAATLPAGVPVAEAHVLPADYQSSVDYRAIRAGCQARWDAAHGVWAVADGAEVIGFVRASKLGELTSVYPAELGLAPPAAWVWSATLAAALSALAVGGAWLARWRAKGVSAAAVSPLGAAAVAAGGPSAITAVALLVYQLYLTR